MENITFYSMLMMLIYWVKDVNTTKHVFSNSGMHTTTGTPTTVYWYAALIKNPNIKTIEI